MKGTADVVPTKGHLAAGTREDETESLILAQDKRWRRALSMQVERTLREGGEWRTAEEDGRNRALGGG